jgi:hypothetical protein
MVGSAIFPRLVDYCCRAASLLGAEMTNSLEDLNRANAIAAVYLVFDSYPKYALTQMNDILAGEIVKAVCEALDPDTPSRTCATCHAVLADGPQPLATYDAGEHEGCGADSEAAFRRWEAERALTVEAMTRQNIEYHDRICDLAEWVRETISLWKRGDIKTAHIQRGQILLED